MMKKSDGKMTWLQFALFGTACTIGTGFFLGTSIGIRKSGGWILLTFVMAAAATLFVYDALFKLSADRGASGSFRNYAKEAFGDWAGFGIGWIYWCSEILILGSTITALGLFTRFWLPDFPLWVASAGYALLAVLIVALGVRGLGKAENILGMVKIAAIIMFVIIALVMLFNGKGPQAAGEPLSRRLGELVEPGWKGIWTGLLYAFYAFGGIEVMGLMAGQLRRQEEASKAGRTMIGLVLILYILSVGLSLVLVPKGWITPHESPFVIALGRWGLDAFVHIMNGVLITAGFSILVAALYAVTTMLVTLSKDHDAPRWMSRTAFKREIPYFALLFNAAGLAVSITMALLIPNRIFEHITTAGGLVLLYTWMIILFSYLRLNRPTAAGQVKSWTAVIFIIIAITGTWGNGSSLPGFWISLLLVLLVGVATAVRVKKRKQRKGATVRARPRTE